MSKGSVSCCDNDGAVGTFRNQGSYIKFDVVHIVIDKKTRLVLWVVKETESLGERSLGVGHAGGSYLIDNIRLNALSRTSVDKERILEPKRGLDSHFLPIPFTYFSLYS